MKRKKPDKLQFAIWAHAHLKFGDVLEYRAGALWNHWQNFARNSGVEQGTQRSFSLELKRIGSPWLRSRPGKRSRYNQGVSLIVPLITIDDVPCFRNLSPSLLESSLHNINMYEREAYR